MGPRVFIPNQGCHDFTPAKQFGELVILSEGRFPILATGRMFRIFQHHIEFSLPEDLVLICGPSVMSATLAAMFAAKHQKVNLLLYTMSSAGVGSYKKRTINLKQ